MKNRKMDGQIGSQWVMSGWVPSDHLQLHKKLFANARCPASWSGCCPGIFRATSESQCALQLCRVREPPGGGRGQAGEAPFPSSCAESGA